MSKPVKIAVTADTRKARAAFANLSSELGLDKAASGFKTLAANALKAGAALATASAAGGVKFVSMASDLQQSIGAVDAIFKEHSGQVHAYAKGAAKNLGLARNEYNELAAVMATQLKNGGTSMEELGGKTNDLIKVGADLSAMFGGTTKEAVEALSSALKGERNPIERYGVSLKQATIEAKAAELGFEKVGGALSSEAEQAATLALIMEQTTDAHGAFDREADTLAGRLARVKAQFKNFGAELGERLLPAVEKAAGWLGERLGPALDKAGAWIDEKVAPAMRRLAAWVQEKVVPAIQDLYAKFKTHVLPVLADAAKWIREKLLPALGKFARKVYEARGWLIPLAGGLLTAVAAFRAITKVMRIARAAVLAVKTAVALFNAVLAVNPIVLVIAAVAGLVAGLVLLYNRSAKFRAFVDNIWGKLKKFGAWLAELPGKIGQWMGQAKDWIVRKWNEAVDWVQALPGRIADALSDLASKLKAKASEAWNSFIEGGRALWGSITSFVSEWVGKILGGLANLGRSLWDKAKSAFNSFIDGIKAVWGTLTSTISQWVDKILTGLANLGRWLWDKAKSAFNNFVDGIVSVFGTITSTVASIPGKIVSALGWVGRLLWDKGKTIITSLLNGLKNTIGTVTSWVGNIGSKIKGAVGWLGDLLWSAGKAILDGLLAGLKAAWQPIQDFLDWVTDKIPDWKGPYDRDKTLLTPAGRAIMGGLLAGLQSQRGALRKTQNAVTSDITGHQLGVLDAPTLNALHAATAHGHARAGQVINIHVHALEPTPEVGRRVARALADYHALNGR